MIYYFFDYRKKKSLQVSTFLRCILLQAIRRDLLHPNIQRRLESLFLDQLAHAEPDIQELEELVIHFLKEFKSSYLLIDGFDEIENNDQKIVKRFLKTVQTVEHVRVWLTLHPAVDLSNVLNNIDTMYMDPQYLEADIELFVQQQLDEHSQEELSICSPILLDKIKQALLSRAEGM